MENSLIDYFELNDITEQTAGSLTEEITSTEDNNTDDSDIQEEVCEGSSDSEPSKSTEDVEKPPEETSDNKETA